MTEGNYGVASVTLNFHPKGRNVNDVTNERKSRRPGGSGVRAAKARYHRIESQGPPGLQLLNFPLISNIIYMPSLGVKVQ